jgi:hypothetical protein
MVYRPRSGPARRLPSSPHSPPKSQPWCCIRIDPHEGTERAPVWRLVPHAGCIRIVFPTRVGMDRKMGGASPAPTGPPYTRG